MDTHTFEQIARELIELLEQQVGTIVGRNFDEPVQEESIAYERPNVSAAGHPGLRFPLRAKSIRARVCAPLQAGEAGPP